MAGGYDTDPLEGINVYLFTGSGSYQGIYEVTDANGQVTFNLPEKDYKVRVDYLSQQHWSDVFSWQDVEVDINHGEAILHITHNGQDLYDVPVYLFTETGSYLSRFERTDSSGQVQFLLPANSYKFRVDYDGTQYWSDVISIIPHEENNIDLQLELLANLTNDPSPVRFDGVPPVYEPEKIMVASLGSIRGLLVNSFVGQTTGGQEIYYFINDHLGTPQKLLNENADVVWSADYKPFGYADVYVNTFENRFRFSRQFYDSETGLHYNYHRYYDPKIGRYLRADPIGLAGGINPFVYCLNDPVNAIDPFGLEVLSPDMITNFVPESPITLPSIGNVDPTALKPGADSSTGPMAFYGAGVSLVIIGGELTVSGAGMIAAGGPVGWIGGTLVGGTGIAIWGFGIWTFYQGWQLDSSCQ